MWRATVRTLGTVAAAVLAGCVPGGAKRDVDFELQKAEQARSALQQQISSEQARAAALEKRAQGLDVELKTMQAQVAALNDHVTRVEQRNRELQTLLEQQKTRALKRPEVPASPLPAATDSACQALVGKYGERVWYDRGRGAVSFANDRLFDPGRDVVRTDAHAALHELAGILAAAELADYEVIVVGHTDATPITKAETQDKHPTNWHLSVHRAIAVKDVLVRAGLPEARLGVMGYADQRPVSSDPAQNRRVEVFIVRKGAVQPFVPVTPGARR